MTTPVRAAVDANDACCKLIEHLANPAMLLSNAASLAVPGRGLLFLSTQSGPMGSLRPNPMINRFSNQRYGFSEKMTCWLLRALFKLNSQTRGAQLFAVARAVAK